MQFDRGVVRTLSVYGILVSTALCCAQFGPVRKLTPAGPWADKSLAPDVRANMVIEKMTLDEKIQMLHGLGWGGLLTAASSGDAVRSVGGAGFIPGIPRLGIPDMQMSDAAVGVARGAGL